MPDENTVPPREFSSLFTLLRCVNATNQLYPPLGTAFSPTLEPLRIGQVPVLHFPPGEIARIQEPPDAHARIDIYSFGLFGPSGPLPLHLTEYAAERLYHYADPGFVEFANIFHHRLTLLFWRSWAHSRPELIFDRRDEQQLLSCLNGLVGHRGEISEVQLGSGYYFAGLFSRETLSRGALMRILELSLNMEVAIDEFVPSRIPVPPASQARLHGQGVMTRLDESVLGQYSYEVSHCVTVTLTPPSADAYQSMKPGSLKYIAILQWLTTCLGQTIEVKMCVQPVKGRHFVTILNGNNTLGNDTWL